MSEIFDAKSIAVLGIMEGIRKKPEMFIGSVSAEGLCNLVWEIIDNCVNEALEGFCNTIKVRLLKNNIIEVAFSKIIIIKKRFSLYVFTKISIFYQKNK